MTDSGMTDPAKLLLLAALLSKDRIISSNAKSFLKELILRRDPRLLDLLRRFESKETGDNAFMESIHDLIEDESSALFNELFAETSLEVGKTRSKEERDQKDLNEEKSLIYGEVDYSSFYKVLRKINPPPGGVFYDLGSGTGKAVFAARLTQDFARCCGVEILHGLHSEARSVLGRYNEGFRHYLCSGQSQQVDLYEGSLLEFDWSDGDLVFANSTCFDDGLMSDMAEKARELKPGAFFVTFTKGLDSPYFEVLERKRYRMSWGPATVFIHRRLGEDGQPVAPARLNTLPSDAKGYEDSATDLDLDLDTDVDTDFDMSSSGKPHFDDDDDDDDEDDDEDEPDEVDLGSEEEEEYEDEFDSDGALEQPQPPPRRSEPPTQTQQARAAGSPTKHALIHPQIERPSVPPILTPGPTLRHGPAVSGPALTPLSVSLAQRRLAGRVEVAELDREAHSPYDSALMRRKVARLSL